MRRDPSSLWTGTARRRRLAFVLAVAPGAILLVAAVNLWASPWLLALSLAWIALVVWRLRGLVTRPAPAQPPGQAQAQTQSPRPAPLPLEFEP